MTISHQFLTIVVLFISGLFFGAIIDWFRLSLANAPVKIKKYKHVLEIILWILLGGLTFWILYWVKFGSWRYIDPVAQWMGIISYDIFFKGFARFIGRILYVLIIRPIVWICTIVLIAFLFMMKCLWNIVKFPITFTKNLVGKILKKSFK